MAKKKTSPSAGAASEGAKAPAARRRSASAATSAPRVRVRATARSADPKAADPTYDEIAEAAYHRYLNRGGGDGRDFDDWLEAERDLRTRGR